MPLPGCQRSPPISLPLLLPPSTEHQPQGTHRHSTLYQPFFSLPPTLFLLQTFHQSSHPSLPPSIHPSLPPLSQASALIPDNVRKSLTSDQLKTLEAAAEKATKAAAADLDPWFGEAEAEDSSFAPFTTLEAMTGKPVPVPSASGAQDFLEANPYYDQTGIPLNTYKNKEPHTGKIVSVKRMVGPKATGKEGGRKGGRDEGG